MEAEKVYRDYLALKAHFGTNYNYHRYDGQVNAKATTKSFLQHRIFYEKVAKHKDPHGFLLANILANKKVFIRNLAYSPDAERCYNEHRAKIESLTYIFKQDLNKIDGGLKAALDCSLGHPSLVVMYLAGDITLETLTIIAKETNKIGFWEGYFAYDPVMQELLFKIKKYAPFISYDRNKFRKLIVEQFAK